MRILIRTSINLCCAIIACFLVSSAQAKYGGGSGTAQDPYRIYTAEQMNAIGAEPNDWDNHFKLMADIDLSQFTGAEFNIIGTAANPFTGYFYGNDHRISNFTYYVSGYKDDIGLFGYVETANITAVTLINPNVDVYSCTNVGSLVGYAKFTSVTGCCVTGGSIRGYRHVGGLVGYMEYVEGIRFFKDCYTATDVSGTWHVGGLVGHHYQTRIFNCYSSSPITGDHAAGGLVGYSDECSNIFNCYATGRVSGYEQLGGLIGRIGCCCDISNCYATGDVSGSDKVGGLAGLNDTSTIEKCYSIGKVSGNTNVGGLVGSGGDSRVRDSFWDIQKSEQKFSAGGTGKTTAQMKTKSTFTNAGWDFTGEKENGSQDIWSIGEVGDYPRLFWCKRPGDFLSPEGVDFTDYTFLGSHWMEGSCAASNHCDGADLDFSGMVDFADVRIFIHYWMEGIICPYSGGSGIEADPYLIATAEDMNQIGLHREHWHKHFRLIADVNLVDYTGSKFNIIGNDWIIPFSGVFDGNNHTISSFTYETNDTDAIGIFGWVCDSDAEIKNVHLTEPDVEAGSGSYVGSIVGWLLDGTVSGCSAEDGRISGNFDIGGLVGINYAGNILNCRANGSVTANRWAGGLVGHNEDGTIEYCHTTGEVTADLGAGGLTGSSEAENSVAVIKNCSSTANVKATDQFAGGLVAFNQETEVRGCYASGNVNGNAVAGGLIGINVYSTVNNCYAAGSVDGNIRIGGLIGGNYETTIEHCYAAAGVSADANAGGLVGYDRDSNSVYIKSFWDQTVNPFLNGIGNGNDPNVIGETTENMQKRSTFTDVGWDFLDETANGTNDIWNICEGTNYPKLVWQIPLSGDFVCPDGVNMFDFAIFGAAWQSRVGDGNWNVTCDISDPNDRVINELDLTVFTENWLAGM